MENITIGDINHLLTFIATLIGSITAIATVFYKLNNRRVAKQQEAFRKEFQQELQRQLEPFDKRIDETIENNNKNYNEIKAQVKELKIQVDELTTITDNNDIDTIRRSISAFDNMCRADTNNDNIPKHFYVTAFKDINKWADYHVKYPNLNGEMNAAIENIKEHYKTAKFK